MPVSLNALPADDLNVAQLAAALPDNAFATPEYFAARARLGWSGFVIGIGTESTIPSPTCGAFIKSGRLNTTLEIPSLPSVDRASEFWDHLEEFCRKKRVTILQLDSYGSSSGLEIRPFGSRFRHRLRRELVLDLSTEQLAFSSNHKRNIKRARAAGLTVRRAHDAAALAAHRALLLSSLSRRRERGEPIDEAELSNEDEALLSSKAGELFQALDGEVVLSSVLVLKAANGGYYHSAGTSPKGMEIGASHFLIDGIARLLRADGKRHFNLGGAEQGSSLARFKEGFGATSIDQAAATTDVGPRWRRIAVRALYLALNDRQKLRSILSLRRSCTLVYSASIESISQRQHQEVIVFKKLGADDIRSIDVNDKSFRDRQVERLERFHASYAYGLYVAGRLAHVSWLLPYSAITLEAPLVLKAESSDVEITACETLPGYRGGCLYPLAIQKLALEAQLLGGKRLYMKTDITNRASQRGIAKAGLSLVGHVLVYQLPWIKRPLVWRRY